MHCIVCKEHFNSYKSIFISMLDTWEYKWRFTSSLTSQLCKQFRHRIAPMGTVRVQRTGYVVVVLTQDLENIVQCA